jgi:glycosyltransferase involved in cell wall biosynthesis
VISGIVICFNEADRIERCLKSLAFCSEIVVVDSCSTDGTQDVVRKYTDRLIEQPFLGYVKQKNFALDQAKNDWVVCLPHSWRRSPVRRRPLLNVTAMGTH